MAGLTVAATPAHLARATLEAVAHQVADVVEAMEREAGRPVEGLRADGVASASDLLMQIRADLLGRPVTRGGAAGVARLGEGGPGGPKCGGRSRPRGRPAPTKGGRTHTMIIERFRAEGRVALVTGGTRGIGLGIARALCEAGAEVVVAARSDPGGTAALAAEGHAAEFRPCDVAERGAAAALVEGVARDRGRLDILVNNAGVAAHGPTEDFDDARYRRLMAINVDAVFEACRAAIRPMRAAGGGAILNIGSISGYVSNVPQVQVAYNASKAAVHMMTRSLASDLAGDGIRVNAIAPGYILTEMTAGGFERPDWAPVWTAMTPMGRAGTVEEIAAAALFLCTDASSYCTGSILTIDGGYRTR